jgi:hypothetical protein
VANIVEVGVVREGVAEECADGLVNFFGAFVAGVHELLDFLEFFGQWKLRWKFDSAAAVQACDGLLGKIEGADAVVAGPFVDGGLRIVIDWCEGEFVKPGGDVAVGSDVAACGAGAHRDAEDGIDAERHRAGEGGDFAVVCHFEWDVIPGAL